jgi:hypothetical protein
MEGTGKWIWSGLVGLFGLVALYVSAQSGQQQPVGYYGGLAFFVFAVLFILMMIKTSFDHQERPKG